MPSISAETIDAGYFLLRGKLLPRPFSVSCDSKGLTVNGVPYRLNVYRTQDFEPREFRRNPVAAQAFVAEELRNGGMLVSFMPNSIQMVPREDAMYVLAILMSRREHEAKRARLTLLPIDAEAADWDSTLDRFVATGAFRAEWEAHDESVRAGVAAFASAQHFVDRCQRLAGGFGLALLTLAPIVLLRWSPDRLFGWSELNPMQSRIVNRCLPLIVALCALDLWCTLLAGQSGMFLEANPLARTLMDQPVVLIAFKVATTLLSVSLLWWLRRFRGAQVAAWSICLVLTLLAARWQTFHWQYFA